MRPFGSEATPNCALHLQVLQRGEPRIQHLLRVPAVLHVEILAARRAQPLAVLAADRLGRRQAQQELLAEDRPEIDHLAVEELLVGLSLLERGARRALAGVVVALLPLRPRRAG